MTLSVQPLRYHALIMLHRWATSWRAATLARAFVSGPGRRSHIYPSPAHLELATLWHVHPRPAVRYASIAVRATAQSSDITRHADGGLIHDTRIADAVVLKPSVRLRDYQHDAIAACLSAFDRGLTRIGVSSPTGSGKTTMFMHLIPAVCGREDEGTGIVMPRGKALVLVSGIELASQTELAARRVLGPEWRVEVEQGNRKASGRADV